MPKLPLLGGLLLLASSAFAGVASCPDNTYLVFPIPGVTGGTATSCGNATVTGNSVSAATPGGGSVGVEVLSSYLKFDLDALFSNEFMTVGEGSAALLAGFTAPTGSRLAFTWLGQFEEGASGSLFYIHNGELTLLDSRLSIPLQPCDGFCSTNGGTEVFINLAEGENNLAFGAIVLNSKLVPSIALDPSINVGSFALYTPQAAVPEPATLALTGVALLGLAAWRRRRSA